MAGYLNSGRPRTNLASDKSGTRTRDRWIASPTPAACLAKATLSLKVLFKGEDLHRRPGQNHRNHRRSLHPVMQGTAGVFSTVNTKEKDRILTDQDRATKNDKLEQMQSSGRFSPPLGGLDKPIKIG